MLLRPTDCLSGQLGRCDHGERASALCCWGQLTAWVVSWAGLTLENRPVHYAAEAYWLPEWSAGQVWPWRKGQCIMLLRPTDCLSGQLSRFDLGERANALCCWGQLTAWVVSWAGVTMEKGPVHYAAEANWLPERSAEQAWPWRKGPVLRPTDANWLPEWSAGQVWPWRIGQCIMLLRPTDCLSGQLGRFDHGERASAEANWCLLTAWVVSWAGLTMEKGPVLRPTDAYWLPEWSAGQVWPWRKGQCIMLLRPTDANWLPEWSAGQVWPWRIGQCIMLLRPTDCLSGQLGRFDHGERASAEANWCLLTAWVVSWAGLTMEKGPVLRPTDAYWLPEWSAGQVWPWRKGQCIMLLRPTDANWLPEWSAGQVWPWRKGQCIMLLRPTDCLSGQLSRFDHGERASAEANWCLLTAWVVSWAGLTLENRPVHYAADAYWLPEWSAGQVWPWRKGQCWGQLMPTDCLSGQLGRFDHGERASALCCWCLLTAWAVSWAGLTMAKGPVHYAADAYWLPEWSAG